MTKVVESITDMHLFCQIYSLLLSEVSFVIYIHIYIGLFCLHKRDLYMTKAVESVLSDTQPPNVRGHFFHIHIYIQVSIVIYRSLLPYVYICIRLFCHIHIYIYWSLVDIGLFCHICIYVYVSFVIYRSLLPYMYICIRLFCNIYVYVSSVIYSSGLPLFLYTTQVWGGYDQQTP